jgi:hypothetical protein
MKGDPEFCMVFQISGNTKMEMTSSNHDAE